MISTAVLRMINVEEEMMIAGLIGREMIASEKEGEMIAGLIGREMIVS